METEKGGAGGTEIEVLKRREGLVGLDCTVPLFFSRRTKNKYGVPSKAIWRAVETNLACRQNKSGVEDLSRGLPLDLRSRESRRQNVWCRRYSAVGLALETVRSTQEMKESTVGASTLWRCLHKAQAGN